MSSLVFESCSFSSGDVQDLARYKGCLLTGHRQRARPCQRLQSCVKVRCSNEHVAKVSLKSFFKHKLSLFCCLFVRTWLWMLYDGTKYDELNEISAYAMGLSPQASSYRGLPTLWSHSALLCVINNAQRRTKMLPVLSPRGCLQSTSGQCLCFILKPVTVLHQNWMSLIVYWLHQCFSTLGIIEDKANKL